MRAPKNTHTYRTYFAIFFSVIFLLLSFQDITAQQLAFPTAKGAGAYSTGGRGGQVIHVTNLEFPVVYNSGCDCLVADVNDPNYEGSLIKAIQTPGPRIVVFDVSGEIDATAFYDYSNIINGSQYNDLTIAGQTAPLGGITIRTGDFRFANVDNVVIRYIRFRQDVSRDKDALWFWGNTGVVFDHCTFSHGGDEAASWADTTGTMGNITIQNCFFQDSKTGSILGVDDVDGDFSFINNLYSNISHRFPNPKGDGHYDIINNVVYNWRNRLIRVTGEGTYNVMNNYYKTSANGIRKSNWYGPNGVINDRLQKLQTQAQDNPLIYASGSLVTGQRETPLADDSDMWTVFAASHLPEGDVVPAQYFTNTQFPLVGESFEIKTADQAYNDVLADAGANKTLNADGTITTYRDTKDEADILMIENDTYAGDFYSDRSTIPYPIIPQNTRPASFDTNNDGMPDAWKLSRGYAVDADISTFVWPSGYVGIEEYLNEIDLNGIVTVDVTGVEVSPETATINISDVDNTVDLIASILPINASNQSGQWTSSNDAIATVNTNGVVTAIAEGVVTITFTTSAGNFTDIAIITIENTVINLEEVILTPETETIDLGESIQLSTEFIPSNASDKTGIWSSSDNTVATVDENGNVVAQNIGQAEITFVANDSGFIDSSIVTVIDDFFGSYILYNAESDQAIQNITGDATINLGDESDQINFRSIPEGGDGNTEVESVQVNWTGPSSGTWIESGPLYAGLPNGHVDLDFEPYIVVAGTYNFTVTYFSENSGAGEVVAIDTFSLTFFF